MPPLNSKAYKDIKNYISRYAIFAGAFSSSDFRLVWISLVFGSLAMWIEMVAIAWLVLELTNSSFMVGLASAARLAPFFLIGIPIGAVVDRVDRHIFLRFINVGSALIGLIITLLVLLNVVEFWHLMALSFLSGAGRAANSTTRSSYVYDLVGPNVALNGLALISFSQRLGGVLGGLIGGLLIARKGIGITFIVMTVGYIISAIILYLVREVGESAPKYRESIIENLRGAVRSIKNNKTLGLLMLLTAFTEVFGFSHQVLLPIFARDVLDTGADGFGFLIAVRAGGGLIGTLFIASLGNFNNKGYLLLVAIGLFGLGLISFSYSQTLIIAFSLLALTNFAGGITGVLQQTLMQKSVSNEERGRAMGALTLSIGLAPIGHIELGALGNFLGAPFALAINGVILGGIGLLALFKAPSIRNLK